MRSTFNIFGQNDNMLVHNSNQVHISNTSTNNTKADKNYLKGQRRITSNKGTSQSIKCVPEKE